MKILFAASEATPFAKTGGLAEVVSSLPRALVELGHDVAVVLPRYHGAKAGAAVESSLTITLGQQVRFPSVLDGGLIGGVRYYLVDDPELFDRDGLYGYRGADYHDNPERFALLSKTAIEIAKRIYRPDVLHCHDWQTALVPVLLRTVHWRDAHFRGVPSVFTIHNMGYQGMFAREVLARVGLPEALWHVSALEFFGAVNFMKGGLLYADYLTTVSRRYAQEIMTAEYGHGLEGVVRSRAGRLTGFLNGVDYAEWSPETDRHIAAHYSAANLAGKKKCKKALLEEFGLPAEDLKTPVAGIVSRFADQKGFDLIAQVAYEFLKEKMRLVVLGTGEAKYEEFFRAMAAYAPQQVGVKIKYDHVLAHRVEAGADLFLMPSRYEPCGLNQIYSLRYGTIPVVRATGGLDDTVEHFDAATGRGTGFKFEHYSGDGLLWALRQALSAYGQPKAWERLVQNAMAQDFSWKKSALEYARLYEAARASRIETVSAASN
jgi:starch synthase